MNEKKLKKLQTDVKSAQGMIAMSVILNLIFAFRTLVSKKLDFYFSYYVTAFLIKGSELYPQFSGNFSKTAVIISVVAIAVVSFILAALIQKKTNLFSAFLAVYLADSAFMVYSLVANPLGDFSENSFIDVIFHAFVIIFTVVGIIADKKLKKQ